MKVERIHFDDIFDVAPYHGNFSYRSAGRLHYGVQLDKGVIPRGGSAWAVAFGRTGDWSTVLGWRDLSSAKVGLKYPDWAAVLAALGHVYFGAPVAIALALLLGGADAAMAAAAAVAVLAVYLVAGMIRKNRAVERALRAMPEHENAMGGNQAIGPVAAHSGKVEDA